MKLTLTYAEYASHVDSLARAAIEDAIHQDRPIVESIAELIDYDEHAVYPIRALAYLQHTQNDDAFWDCHQGSSDLPDSAWAIYTTLAAYAMERDVSERIECFAAEIILAADRALGLALDAWIDALDWQDIDGLPPGELLAAARNDATDLWNRALDELAESIGLYGMEFDHDLPALDEIGAVPRGSA